MLVLLVMHTASMYFMCFWQSATHVPVSLPCTTSLHQPSNCAERVFWPWHASMIDCPSDLHSSSVSARVASSFPCCEAAPSESGVLALVAVEPFVVEAHAAAPRRRKRMRGRMMIM